MPLEPTACFHCGEPCDADQTQFRTYQGEEQSLCCHGCASALDWIEAQGLDAFYRYRDQHAPRPDDQTHWTLFDDPEFLNAHSLAIDSDLREIELSIAQIRCAACTWLLERVLAATEGVVQSHAHLGRRSLTIRWKPHDVALSKVLARLDQLGYAATLLTDETAARQRKQERKSLLKRIGVAGLGTMQVMMFAAALYVGEASFIEADQRQFLRWVSLIVSIPVMLYAAQPFFLGAWRDLTHRRLGMDVPVALALSLAWTASIIATVLGVGEVYFDSVSMFALFLLTGRYLEMQARHQVLDSPVEARPMPMTLARQRHDGQLEQVPVAALRPGDLVQLAAGQQTPVDLCLVSATGSMDTQALTGEFEQRTVLAGDEILAGSVNGPTSINATVLRIGQNAFLGKLEHLARQAEQMDAPETRWTEPLIRWFIAAVLTVSGLTLVGWWSTDPVKAFEYALSVLVVTCPCALSLAIPTAWTVTIRTLRQSGILLLNPNHLLAFANAKHWVFDKTGTLTEGRFAIQAVRQLDMDTPIDEALSLLSGLEANSPHPIAYAFRDRPTTPMTETRQIPGVGIEGTHNGVNYSVRRAHLPEAIHGHENELTITLVRDDTPILSVALDDAIRTDAADVIGQLQAEGVNTVLLSGDHMARVETIAAALGLPNWQAELSPEGKMHALADIDGSKVMVGDGLNDAPVLAAANGSVTFAQASDLTRLSAGVVLLSPNLHALIDLRRHAKKSRQVIKQSLFWVLMYNLTAVPFAVAGLVPPWLAAIGMSASSVFVITNALRLKKLS